MSKPLLYCFLLFFASPGSTAQSFDEKNFRLYTKADGLSSNTVNAVTQDIYGYIWTGTSKGVNRFDGNLFQHFFSDTSRNSLPDDFVIRLRWLDKERLAVITISGLHIINCRTLQQQNIIIPADSLGTLLPVNRVTDAFGDKNGNLFVGTATGFYQFNKNYELTFRYDHFSKQHIAERKRTAFVTNIIQLEENTLLISTFSGPYLFFTDQNKIHAAGEKDQPFYQQIGLTKTILAIPHTDGEAFTTIDSGEKLYWFDQRGKRLYPVQSPFAVSENIDGGIASRIIKLNDSSFAINSKVQGFFVGRIRPGAVSRYELLSETYFRNFFCHSFLIDRNNHLWIATNKGLFRERKSASLVEQITMPSSFKQEIQSLVVSNKKIFAGTLRNGIMVFDKDSLKEIGMIDLRNHRTGHEFANYVLQIIPVHSDTLYAIISGTWINSKNLNVGKIGISNPDTASASIDYMFQDSRKNIYLKTDLKNIFYYRKGGDNKYSILDYRNNLSKIGFDVSGMAEDPHGNIWFSGAGIMRFNIENQNFDLLLDSFPSIKIPRKGIAGNMVFNKSKIYFGVQSNGLIVYDLQHRTFDHVTRANGLPDNNIQALYMHHDKLWIATENGIASYDTSTGKIYSFGISDGIPVQDGFRYTMYYDSAHGQLYGAFRNTIFRFNPDKLKKNNTAPFFSIESVVVPGKVIFHHPENNISLSYKQNNLVINLSAVNFEDADEQQFAYRFITKNEEPWLPLGSHRSIIFSNLSPAEHRLQVKVFTRNQSWPEQIKEINITIKPPFWKTIWFYLIVAVLLAGLLYYFYRSRISQITRKANIDKQLAQTEMKALHAQMNPHFIFNCLNSIREMILNNENEQASLYLSKFARLIRITLNQSSKPFVSLTDTIDYLERYIEMEKIRNSNFTYTMNVADDLQPDEIVLPPMLIQPFIENAIWHGTSSKKNMGIHISFRKNKNELICIVEDDGIGIDESLKRKVNLTNEPSVGITNIKQRISLLNEKYNLHSTVQIVDKLTLPLKNGTGTIVTLHLPLKTNEGLWNN